MLVIRAQADATQNAAFQLEAKSPGHSIEVSQGLLPAREDSLKDGVMGRLEIKSLGLRVPILDDFDPNSLRKGVGHIRGTAMPGGLGNMALAGHRDTFFRPLRNIHEGMVMSVFTSEGRFDYLVDSTTIVMPEEVSVLAIHDIPEMTLITCYPFDFVGSALRRFIVRAHLKSIEPAAS